MKTLTGNLSLIVGAEEPLYLTLRVNANQSAVIEAAETWLPDGKIDVVDGAFSADLPDGDVSTLWEVRATYFLREGYRWRQVYWSSGWFALAADADLSEVTVIQTDQVDENLTGTIAALVTDAETARDEAAAFGGTNNTQVAGMVTSDGPTKDALSATFAGQAASAAAPLWAKMRQATQDAQILVLGDSTTDDRSSAGGPYSTEWIAMLATKIAAEFPDWTVLEQRWPGGTATAYDAATTVQTGTNGRTLTIYNGAIGGTTWEQPLTSVDAHWRDLSPDLVIVNHGHNDNILASADRIHQLTETVTTVHPHAGLVISTQNPRGDDSAKEDAGKIRAQQIRVAAMKRGYGLIDARRAFDDAIASGTTLASLLNADLLHPNSAGDTLWADAAWAALWSPNNQQALPRQDSSLSAALPAVLANATFEQTWDGTGAPPGWSLSSNGAAAKDASNYETNGYGLQVSQVDAGLSTRGYIEQSIPVAPFAGRSVTLAVRMFIDSSMSGAQVGRISITDSVDGEYNPRESSTARGRFFWAVATKYVPATATGDLTFRIYADWSVSTGAGSMPTIDRVSVTHGDLPRDVLPPSREPAEMDYWSPFAMGNPLIGAAFAAKDQLAVIANRRLDVPWIAPRDGVLTGISWVHGVVSGNYDMALVDDSGALLWSKGSTAMGGAGAKAVTAETVSPGVAVTAGERYWVQVVFDNATATLWGVNAGVTGVALLADGSLTVRSKTAAGPPIAADGIGTTDVGTIPFFRFTVS